MVEIENRENFQRRGFKSSFTN